MLGWSLPLFVSGLFAAPPVTIESAPDCPSAAAVSRELERIVVAPPGSATDTALVALEGAELRIVLTTKEGSLLGERRLPADGNCDERALSVAVVLGAWIATAHPEYLSTLPDAEARSAPGDDRAREAPATDGEAEPLPPPIPAPDTQRPARAPTQSSASRPVRAPPEDRFRFQAALGAGAEISNAGLVPAGEVSLRYAPEASGFGASAFFLIASPEERSVGSGRLSSYRWPLGAGGLFRLDGGAVAFELDAGLMLGLLHVQGEGFTSANDGATDVQGGVYGAARLGAGSGRWRPFGAAKLLTWLGEATAQAQRPAAEVDLPAVEAVLLVGLGYVL